MRVLVTEFLASATCELSGKTGECLKVVMDQNSPPAVVSPTELIKLLRFTAQQEAKRAVQAAAKERTEQAKT